MATVMAHTFVQISTGGWVPRQPAAYSRRIMPRTHTCQPSIPIFSSTQWSASGVYDVPALALSTAFAVC